MLSLWKILICTIICLSKGFEIINITTLEYLAYASNFLCVKNGTIVSVEVDRIVKDILKFLNEKAAADSENYGKLLTQAMKGLQISS